MSDVKTEMRQMALDARAAANELASMSSTQRNQALLEMADALVAQTDMILQANERDMARAKENGMSPSLQDRLLLTQQRIADIAQAMRVLAAENDPVGQVVEGRTLQSGLKLTCVRVPLGVVAMIYEARPNVTADAAALCIKTANACILRGGSAAVDTNIAMTQVLAQAAEKAGLPLNCIQQVQTTSREATTELMSLHGLIDVLIPRGGYALIQNCVENSKVPVIETGTGNCHIYLEQSGDIEMARDIVINAKCQRPGVCNAAESLLVDQSVAQQALPVLMTALAQNGVLLHADPQALQIGLDAGLTQQQVVPATPDDWGTEYLALEISVKLVSGVDEAIQHINTYGTKHSEAIVTSSYEAAQRFTSQVDAAAVYVNASTRFTDGGMFGLGAEIGISTQKLHARGPMGLTALTTTKYVLMGEGQTR